MIYLDNAGTTYPKPNEVYDAVLDCMKNFGANPGRAGHKLAMRAGMEIYEARENIARLLNIDNPMNIIFTHNATDSLNLGLKGILKQNDHVITTSIEHNSVIRPIKALESIGVTNTIVNCNEEGYLNPVDIENAITPNTKMIITTHASNVCGTIVDIEAINKIAKKHNIIYFVDASQTLGVYDIDLEKVNIDLLAAPGHKGLLGPQGTGILYIRDNLNLKHIKEGGTGSNSEDLFQPEMLPDKYESGTHNTPGIAGLNAGVKFILNNGINKIREHEESLTQYMIEELLKIPQVKIYGPKNSKKQAAVISINIEDMDSGEVTYILDDEYNIATRSGIHCSPVTHRTLGTLEQGTVRFSIGYFNKKSDIDCAIVAIKDICERKNKAY